MFLDKESRKVLDYMIGAQASHTSYGYTFKDLSVGTERDLETVKRIAQGLECKQLVTYTHYGTGAAAGVMLTQDGYRYHELQRLKAAAKWKERAYGFISGVVVSVLGGVILKLLVG